MASDAPPRPFWYHTIELPGETTRGHYDLRSVAPRVLPGDLSGRRCLDAATASGFWAFEMERRGAAEVVAIDLPGFAEHDWQEPRAAPPGDDHQARLFGRAREALGSRVVRRELSVYDAAPEALGRFDLVFLGSVLLHLRDPVAALRALRTVTAGTLLSLEPVLLVGSLLRPRRPVGHLHPGPEPRWWTPNAAGHRRWLAAGGFEVQEARRLRQPFGRAFPRLPRRPPARSELPFWLLFRHLGAPSQLLRARPADDPAPAA